MPEGTLHVGPDEVRALLAFSRRQFLWDMRMPVRVVSTASAIGLYTAPPLGVLALFAVPGTIDIPSDAPLDVTVSLSSLVSELESASASARDIDLERLHPASVPVTSAMSVAFLPPSDGWQVPMHAVAGDLGLRVDEAVAEFTLRSAGQGEAVQQQIADEIWERTVWAALPMRVLHAAKQLGMLGNDRSRVSAASCGTWKRFSTSRGHVFIRPAPTPTRTALRLLM